MNPLLAEFIGTALLILFGNGVVANVVLAKTKGHGAGWIVITAGWGFAVFVGAFCAAPFSGAHLNPAVSVAMVAAGKLPTASLPGYLLAQLAGAFTGACLVYAFYREHFNATEDQDLKLACFCTAPNIRKLKQAFFCETLGTYVLILPIFLITSPQFSLHIPPGPGNENIPIGLGSLGLIPVGLLVFAIGLSLGGTTGYAINPARDLAPRIAHALLPIRNKRNSDFAYAWVPTLAPVLGALLAAWTYAAVT
jgi:glycerol uptake facilitator protein